MTLARLLAGATLATPLALAQPACAKPGDPILIAEDVTIDPIIDGRIRYEHVDQTVTDADAVTMRLRAGAEVKVHNFAVLAEAEGMLSIEIGRAHV